MKLRKIPTIVGSTLALTIASNAAIVTIGNLELSRNGVLGGQGVNVTGTTINGVAAPIASNVIADPIAVALTYNNLDLDGDTTANDSVTFTLTATGTNLRLIDQGFDQGFGSINSISFSISDVSGTTTDSGQTILFDGFTGATVAAGGGAAVNVDRFVDVNGTTVNLTTVANGSFQFKQEQVDFALTNSLIVDNGGGTAGSLVVRGYDLQFSTVPEPSVALLGALGVLGLVRRRR